MINKSLLKELHALADELDPWYDWDKIKSYAVYIWAKPTEEDPWGRNLFDIFADEIIFYVEDHVIPAEAMPIIKKIQAKLRKID